MNSTFQIPGLRDERFQSIYNSVNDAIFIHDLNTGAILDVNQRMCEMFGCSRDEACSQPVEAFSAGTTPYSQAEAITWMKKAAAGEPQIFEWRAKTLSGKLFWVEVNMRRARIGDDERILVTARDISSRKETDNALLESRAFVENLLNTANAMIIGLDLEGRITIFNPAAEKITGYSRDEIEKLNWFETLTPRDRYPQVWQEHLRLTAGGIPKYFENPIVTKSGEERFIVWSNNEVMESGRIIGTISFGQDVTERKRTEDALRESEERLRVIFDTSDSGIILVTPQGVIDFANKRMAEMFRMPLQELIGTAYPEHLHESEKKIGDERMRMLIRGEIQSVANERCYIRKDGSNFWGYLSGRRLENPDGTLRALVGVITDLSDRKKAEEDKICLERQLLHSQKLESLGILSGGIAHDFNNLLQALLGNLDLALMKLPDDSIARKNITQAVNAGKHAAKLTNMMLAYSGKGLFVIRELNLTELVEENAAMLEAAISKTITLDLNLDHTLPPILADAGQIQQVIMNLITNASEAIGDKGGIIMLSTGLNEFDQTTLNSSRLEEKLPPGPYVWMKVCDNGCGMDENTLHKLFDPFFTTKFTGRGLGMSAVLGIMRGHNGAFLVDSKPGFGTKIQVLFPIAVSTKAEITNASLETAESATADTHRGIILIVDDEKMIREVTVAMLHELGYESLTAADGREAVRIFREQGEGIRLVLLDQIMPGMDGVEVFKELRIIRPDITVLLASGYSELEMVERFKGLGLSGFIQKPYNLEQLADEIRRTDKVT